MPISTNEAKNLLGLSNSYSVNDIDRAFKSFAKKYHPDVCRSYGIEIEIANQMMIKATEARELLKKTANVHSDSPYEPEADNSYQPSPTPTPEPVYSYASTTETKTVSTTKKSHPLLKTLFDAIYRSEHEFGSVGFSLLLLGAGWTLPFYLFGGLNLFPFWEGVLPLDGWSFLFAYLIVPVVSFLNLISPIHFINMFIRGFVMAVLFPVKKVLAY